MFPGLKKERGDFGTGEDCGLSHDSLTFVDIRKKIDFKSKILHITKVIVIAGTFEINPVYVYGG